MSRLKEQNILYSFDVDNELLNRVICKEFLTLERLLNATCVKEKPLILFLSSWGIFLPIYKIIDIYQAEDKNSHDTTTYLYSGFFPSRKKIDAGGKKIARKIKDFTKVYFYVYTIIHLLNIVLISSIHFIFHSNAK